MIWGLFRADLFLEGHGSNTSPGLREFGSPRARREVDVVVWLMTNSMWMVYRVPGPYSTSGFW